LEIVPEAGQGKTVNLRGEQHAGEYAATQDATFRKVKTTAGIHKPR